MTDPRQDTIVKLGLRPMLAHAVLFPHRHTYETPPFHLDIVDLVHSPASKVLLLAFRGGGKSTLVEEAIVVRACLRKFKNALIVGANLDRAVDRLRSIKHEFETNLFLEELFGPLQGAIWQEKKITLANGLVIQAQGQGQALRGAKHLDARPDFVFIDDLEEQEDVSTPEARDKLKRWFFSELIPAAEPNALFRMAATPLDPKALAVEFSKLPSWTTARFPIVYKDKDTGARTATWPAKFPLPFVDKTKHDLYQSGQSTTFEQEYMLEASDPASRVFLDSFFKFEPRVRTWHPTYAVYDPARTTNKNSATTGRVVASWIANRLVVWEADGHLWKPDEMIEDMFRVDSQYQPIAIGVEEDGLHEFIMQPLRHEQTKRAHLLPIRPLKAPRGKLDFIRALQPYFKAGEVVFADGEEAFENARAQFLSFPTGAIDVPNAFAYLLTIRAGVPLYEGFSQSEHVVPDLTVAPSAKLALAINADNRTTTGVLVALVPQGLSVLADFVREGDAGFALADLVRDARLAAGRGFTAYAPKEHFNAYDTAGLRPAAKSALLDIRRAGDVHVGREELRRMLERRRLLVHAGDAPWTLKALSGGYARPVGKEHAVEGAYKLLMEGLEALAGYLVPQAALDKDVRYATTQDGRSYISARA